MKRIVVKPGERLSLQMHFHRAEHWIVVRGTAEVGRDDEIHLVHENESIYLPIGCKHRLIPARILIGKIDIVPVAYNRGSGSRCRPAPTSARTTSPLQPRHADGDHRTPEALRRTGAPAVDVSSGVERERGVKDAGRIKAFVEAVRSL